MKTIKLFATTLTFLLLGLSLSSAKTPEEEPQLPQFPQEMKFPYPLKVKKVPKPTYSLDLRPKNAPVLTDPGDRVTAMEGSYITIRWTRVPGATSYDVEKAPNRSFDHNATIDTTRETETRQWMHTFERPYLPLPQTYYYRVKGRNNDGSGPWSNIVDITVLPKPREARFIDEAPQLRSSTITSLSDQTFTLSWTPPAGTNLFYTVEESSSLTFERFRTNIIARTERTSYSLYRVVTYPTTHYYRVRASNSLAQSPYSNIISIVINPR